MPPPRPAGGAPPPPPPPPLRVHTETLDRSIWSLRVKTQLARKALRNVPPAVRQRYAHRRDCYRVFCGVLCCPCLIVLWSILSCSPFGWLARYLVLPLAALAVEFCWGLLSFVLQSFLFLAKLPRTCAAWCCDRRYSTTACDVKHFAPPPALPPLPLPSTLSTELRRLHRGYVHLNVYPADSLAPTLLLPGDMVIGRLIAEDVGSYRARLVCVERLHVYSDDGCEHVWKSMKHYQINITLRSSGDFSVVIPDGAPPTFTHPIDGLTPWYRGINAHNMFVAHVSHELVVSPFGAQAVRIPLLVAASSTPDVQFLNPSTGCDESEFPSELCHRKPGSVSSLLRLPHRVALRPTTRCTGWFVPEVGVTLDGGLRSRLPAFLELRCVVEITDDFTAASFQRSRVFSVFKLPLPRLGEVPPYLSDNATHAFPVLIPDSVHEYSWSSLLWCEKPLPLPPTFTSEFFRVRYQLVFRPTCVGVAAGGNDVYSVELFVTDNAHAMPSSPQVAIALSAPSPATAVAVAAAAGTDEEAAGADSDASV